MSKITIDLNGAKEWLADAWDDYKSDWRNCTAQSIITHLILAAIIGILLRG